MLDQPRPLTKMEPWEFAGYTDTLNRYLLEDKLSAVDNNKELAEQFNRLMKQLDEMAETES